MTVLTDISTMQIRVDPAAFMSLGREIISHPGRRNRLGELRAFRSHFGTVPVRCCLIWNMLRACDEARAILNGALPKHLLWALMFLKLYGTEATLCGKAKCDEKTFRKWSWKFVQAIALLLHRVVVFDRRFLGANGHRHTMSIDGTDCRINEPTPFDRKWYSHKFRSAGVRYEIGVALRRSEIVWVNGPFPCGRNPDLVIFRNGLKARLRAGERVLADKGYRGEAGCVDIPRDQDPANLRRWKARIASRHETVNKRLKNFNVLVVPFRHNLRKHRSVFHAVTVVTQVNLTNGDPLFDVMV